MRAVVEGPPPEQHVIIKVWHGPDHVKRWDHQESWCRLWIERHEYWEVFKPHRVRQMTDFRKRGWHFPDENDA